MGAACDNSCQWLEGIGNFCNLLYIEIPALSCDTNFYNTECFWQNGVYVTGGTFCDFSTGISKITSSVDRVEVYPNPVFGISNIKSGIPEDNFGEYVILNSIGENIKRISKDQRKGFSINAAEYSPGIYLLVTKTKNNNFSFVKFAIQH